jgi:PAS domain S-box-containing protein
MQYSHSNARHADGKLFQSLTEHAPQMTVLLDDLERVIYVSPSVERVLGLTFEQVSNPRESAFMHGADFVLVRELLARARQRPGEEFSAVVELRDAAGRWLKATLYVSNLLLVPAVGALVITAHQVLTTSQIAAELSDRERTSRALLDANPETALLITPDGTILAANKTAAIRLGDSMDNLAGSNLFSRLPPDLAELRRGYVEEAISTRGAVSREETLGARQFFITVLPVVDSRGQVQTLAVFGMDLTRRYQAELALQDREATLRVLLDANPDPTMLVDSKGTILSANEGTVRRLGQPLDKLIGSNVFDWLPPEIARTRRARGEAAVRDQKPVHWRDENRGAIYDNYIYPVTDAGGKARKYALYAVNVTEQARAQQALAISEERFRQMASVIPVVFWMVSPDLHTHFFLSQAFEAVYGRTCESLYEDYHLWRQCVHPDDLAMVDLWWRDHSLEPTELEYRIVRPDGTIRWVRDVGLPVKNDAGELVMLSGFTEDITERRARLSQLAQADKMAGLGLLASGIAHQLRNPLAIISSWVQLLQEHPRDRRLREDSLPRIRAAAERASRVIEALLKFSRPGEMVVEPLDVRKVLDEALDLLAEHMTAARIDVRRDWQVDLGQILGSPDLLMQVFTNLAINARSAMPSGGTLSVSCCAEPGGGVRIAFSDTGQGITQEDLQHVFDPFFTTRGPGEGTGLGLTVSHTVIQQHHGTIEVQSRPGEGTTFTVRLP